MRCVALRHVAFEDLGLFAPVVQRRGYEIEYLDVGLHTLSGQDWADADLVVVMGGATGVCNIEASAMSALPAFIQR